MSMACIGVGEQLCWASWPECLRVHQGCRTVALPPHHTCTIAERHELIEFAIRAAKHALVVRVSPRVPCTEFSMLGELGPQGIECRTRCCSCGSRRCESPHPQTALPWARGPRPS